MRIHSNLRHASDIIEPTRGFPTLPQVTNCAKYLRMLQGTKNSIKAVKEIVQKNAFDPTGDLTRAFCFGHRESVSGHAVVGKGTDADSFVVGVSSRALVEASIEYASGSRFTLFHADATFKLSDLGYPVITCGFSDASRSYQLAAIFIVSRRTAKEYAMCLEAFVRLVKQVRPTATLSIDAVMGDAEDAQLNGFQQVSEFGNATYLMCFFHVLYNVRKRTKHLAPEHRKAVMNGIIRIHYTDNMTSYYTEKDEVVASWRKIPELEVFVKYFTEQWLDSRYWRWQVFHTPIGYATTNNPCETFNTVLKKYTRRRRYHMQRLLQVTFTVISDAPKRTPHAESDIQVPSTLITKAAFSMIATG
ncbi:hypothetical protein PC116_g17594 [Phytophthora cactorum]|nr:hypothetical protein PC122_g14370 [Phytophthora cactorum]KAG3182579.1 hypothetical protein C6341_g5879 [Phytophthora cactorum]KAG4234232.1 hypothetical protein PC116_g17594 [Phytophthora cactorum]